MGRRALPKFDPSLDLTRHFRELTDLPPGFDLKTLFARPEAPLEVEVGSGKGLFLSSASRQLPERNFLGIEIAFKYARHAAVRLRKADADNGVMLHGDGLRLFREFIPDASLAAVHVYFPDPWWKKRHRKRRVMNEALLHDIQRTLQPDGRLHFWTDVAEYFESTLELIASVSPLEGPLAVAERPPEHDLDYRTHFERRMRLHGEPVYRSEYRKAPSDRQSPPTE